MKAPFAHCPTRCPLSQFPTPLHRLHRLAEALEHPGPLWIKRDDLTGLALGGNKVRKLEFLLADAQAKGATDILTAGGPQSNHCRLTAAACARLGLRCHLILGGELASPPNGNTLLDALCGATLHVVAPSERNARLASLAREIDSGPGTAYPIPVGGSNGLGAVGYALAMAELRDQYPGDWNELGTIVVATSSGGTQAGLTLGARALGFRGTVLGLSIDQEKDRQPSFQSEMAAIAQEAARCLQLDLDLEASDFHLNADYLGNGYGVLGQAEQSAIESMARLEGIFVGPVYTGRALAGMIDLIRQGHFGPSESVLFWHTGDAPALFAYADAWAPLREC